MSAVLKANERGAAQNSNLRKLRAEGKIPAVVYGKNTDSKPVFVDSKDFIKTIREVGRNGIISLDVNGSSTDVMLGDYQEDSIKREILHVDFRAVDMSSEVTANVRITLVGEAAGAKDGGVVQQPVHELPVTATPGNIPQAIEVDITNLQVGENLTVADIRTGASYQINEDESLVLVSILPPKQEEEISTGEEQEPGIPENEEGRETEASES
ncbi:50S ribosomal protein L25/general stress protein Ctc [Bacillus sp. FJAT-27251]|uniref:50S ribosomal protein L25/general stress protein Ctc n=1 Tax=Bacillus sp. FJAT-27251 TaxID=1684142 RepID=UPI0006A7967A|nr:50S ribosomal protein L25/general stress protein Ctc [Bacillus sp. FJAT-27251]